MSEFLKKFFGYYRYKNEEGKLGIPEAYRDELGKGTFSDWRHFTWMGAILMLSIVLYQLFKRNTKAGEKTVFVLSVMLFIIRLMNQIVRAIFGAEYPAWRAFPFHLCTVLTFIIPIVVVFRIKWLKTPLYTLAIMGGIITVFMGDYFNNQFLTFSAVEGIWAHSVLILIPIIEIATGQFKFEFKKSWSVFGVIVILLIWATLANEVFFKEYDPNYMYLKENSLPGNLGGDYYLIIYGLAFLFVYGLIIGIPTLYRKLKNN